MAKNSRTVFQRPNLVRQKIDKELSMGRIAGPFINPSFPTFRVSHIGLVPKKDGNFRMMHNWPHPMHNSVNDFIDSELCAVRYANIDDAVKLVKRIGRNGKLAKADVKKCISFTSSFSERFWSIRFLFWKQVLFCQVSSIWSFYQLRSVWKVSHCFALVYCKSQWKLQYNPLLGWFFIWGGGEADTFRNSYHFSRYL